MKYSYAIKHTLIIFFVFISLLFIWEAFSFFNRDLAFVLPSPIQVLGRLIDKYERFIFHAHITLNEMLSGFLLAFLVAFPLAWMMDLFKSARAVLQPIFIIIQCIPMFTLAPIMIIWFGWTSAAIIVPTALMIFFPLTINIYQGLRSTPQDLIDYFKVNQATPWQIFFKLKLPWSLPHIFAGIRLSSAIAGIAAVAGEWAGAQQGLGILMVESRRDTDLETNFGALFCLTVMSCSLYLIAIFFEHLASKRRPIQFFSKSLGNKLKTKTALSCCVLLAGLSFFSLRNYEARSEPIRLTLDWLPNPNHVPLFVGVNKGFFEKEGIKLKLQKLHDSGHATSYLTTGQSELALNYMPHTIRVLHKGAELTLAGILVKEPLNAIIYKEGKGIFKPEDLSNKILGYCTGGKECRFLNAFLSENDIFPKELRNTGYDLVPYLGTDQVDAIYGAYWNIEAEHLRSLGINAKYFKLEEFGIPNYYELIILAKTGSEQAKPEFIVRFKKALQESIDYSVQHPEEAFAIYSKNQLDKSNKTQQWEKAAWQLTIPALATQQDVSEEVWKTFENWLRDHQLL